MRLILLLAFLASGISVKADEARYLEARSAYEAGDSARALDIWQELAAERGTDAALLAAMGNAEWRLGRKGRALVCWERALLIDASQPVARAGIDHAVALGGVDRPAERWYERYAALMAFDLWVGLGLLAGWAWLGAWAWPRLHGKRMGDVHHRAALVAATTLALITPGIWGSWQRYERAVNRVPDEPLKLTPTLLGEPLAILGEGDIVRTGRELNGHVRVTLAGSQVGWLRLAALEPVAAEGGPRELDSPTP